MSSRCLSKSKQIRPEHGLKGSLIFNVKDRHSQKTRINPQSPNIVAKETNIQTPQSKAVVRRCSVCGKHPVMKKYSSSYWYASCSENHFADSSACPMKTQKAAWEAWDCKFPPNVPALAQSGGEKTSTKESNS